jgi:hypothetical protein
LTELDLQLVPPLQEKEPRDPSEKKALDPLAELYQMEKIECTPAEKEALVLVSRLMGNIEEFYVLQEQISDILTEDESSRNNITGLLGSMISALRFEQSFTGKETSTILEK